MTAQIQIWRIFASDIPNDGQHLVVENDEHHFLRNVLRLRIGEAVEITDGRGAIAKATLVECGKHDSKFIVQEKLLQQKLENRVLLFVGMPKPTALEELVLLTTELGAAQIHLMRTQKVQNKQELRPERLQRIMRESMRISRSAWETEIIVHDSISSAASTIPLETSCFLCDESPLYENTGVMQNHLLTMLMQNQVKKEAAIFIGPEASFTDAERELIREKTNAKAVTLGPNILRTPTAAAAATSICLGYFHQS